MMDERTRRAGERAAKARRRAFAVGDATPTRARPLGVVPVLLLCLVGAVVDAYAVTALAEGAGFDLVKLGLAAFAVASAYALTADLSWAWTITWMYLALHVFVDLLTVDVVGPIGFAIATVYALALTYASARRATEVVAA